MSDYFGALMRSSAMVVGGQAPARAVPRTVPSLEVVGERVAPAVTAHAEIAPAVAMMPAAATAQSVHDNEPVAETSADAAVHAVTVPASPGDSPKASAQPVVAPDAKASPAHELVRAAMRWVAADPQHAPAVPERAGQEEPASSLPGATVVEVLAPPPVHVDLAELESRSLAIPADDYARPTTPVGSPVLDRPAHSERVEISIGAIHLRVDAPAPQTTARTPAAPPPPARSSQATAASSRSALARRSLRRI